MYKDVVTTYGTKVSYFLYHLSTRTDNHKYKTILGNGSYRYTVELSQILYEEISNGFPDDWN